MGCIIMETIYANHRAQTFPSYYQKTEQLYSLYNQKAKVSTLTPVTVHNIGCMRTVFRFQQGGPKMSQTF